MESPQRRQKWRDANAPGDSDLSVETLFAVEAAVSLRDARRHCRIDHLSQPHGEVAKCVDYDAECAFSRRARDGEWIAVPSIAALSEVQDKLTRFEGNVFAHGLK